MCGRSSSTDEFRIVGSFENHSSDGAVKVWIVERLVSRDETFEFRQSEA